MRDENTDRIWNDLHVAICRGHFSEARSLADDLLTPDHIDHVVDYVPVGKDLVRDAKYMRLATRICAELGATYVKTYYTAEDFDTVTAGCPVPIVIAGGKKIPEKDAVKLAHDAIQAGASGVDMGRNIFQSDCPVGMIRAVRAVVQDAEMARAFGIDPRRVAVILSGLATAYSALAGVFIAMFQALSPSMTFAWFGIVFPVVILGGLGSSWGALGAGVIVGVSAAVATVWWGPLAAPLVTFLLLIAALLFRPGGLFTRGSAV